MFHPIFNTLKSCKPHWWPRSLSSESTCWASRWVTGSRAWWVLLLTPSVSKQISWDDALCLLPRWNMDYYLDIFNTPLAVNAPWEFCQGYLLLLHFYWLPAVFQTISIFRQTVAKISSRLNLYICYINPPSTTSRTGLPCFHQRSVLSVSGSWRWGCPQSEQLTEVNFSARRCGKLAVTWGYGRAASCNFPLYLAHCGMTMFDGNLGRWKKKGRGVRNANAIVSVFDSIPPPQVATGNKQMLPMASMWAQSCRAESINLSNVEETRSIKWSLIDVPKKKLSWSLFSIHSILLICYASRGHC